MRLVKFFTIGFTLIALANIWTAGKQVDREALNHNHLLAPTSVSPVVATSHVGEGTPEGWFETMRPACNPVQVETQHSWSPPPTGLMGTAYSATCYALAGKIDTARELILGLEGDDQWRAAGVVFNVAHPVADAGNDLAAGPIMELVVEFWPNHYMALYHAGAARSALGEHEAAAPYLERFLEHYHGDDGWTRAATEMLDLAELVGC
ncbi:MAG: hypothetical protein ACR2QM_03155 [Longimicrobiales bacterium]